MSKGLRCHCQGTPECRLCRGTGYYDYQPGPRGWLPFRCPTCNDLLPHANVRRCPSCGQSLRRRRPHVLGEDTRLGSATLPVDRWMLDRLDAGGFEFGTTMVEPGEPERDAGPWARTEPQIRRALEHSPQSDGCRDSAVFLNFFRNRVLLLERLDLDLDDYLRWRRIGQLHLQVR